MLARATILGIALFLSGLAAAAEFGVGANINSNTRTIYFPVEVSESFRLEPALSYKKLELPDNEYEVEELALSLGLLKKHLLVQRVQSFYGARLSYFNYNSDGIGTQFGSDLLLTTNDVTGGYSFAPLVGLEYRFSDRFTIAAEAALEHKRLDGSDGEEYSSTKSNTSVIARFFY